MDGKHTQDPGFSLVELLVVLVTLGVLATIVVFTVRGVTDQAKESACGIEWRVIEVAQESYQAEFGRYTDMAGLVASDNLRMASRSYDVDISSSGGYVITPTSASTCSSRSTSITTSANGGSGNGGSTTTTMPNPVGQITYAGMPAQSYGTGGPVILLLDTGNTAEAIESALDNYAISNPPPAAFTLVVANAAAAIDQGASAAAVAANAIGANPSMTAIVQGTYANPLSDAYFSADAPNWERSGFSPSTGLDAVIGQFETWRLGTAGGTPTTIDGQMALKKANGSPDDTLILAALGSNATSINNAFFGLTPTALPSDSAVIMPFVGFVYDSPIDIAGQTIDRITSTQAEALMMSRDVTIDGARPKFYSFEDDTHFVAYSGPASIAAAL